MESDALDPAHADCDEAEAMLQESELALDGGAATFSRVLLATRELLSVVRWLPRPALNPATPFTLQVLARSNALNSTRTHTTFRSSAD